MTIMDFPCGGHGLELLAHGVTVLAAPSDGPFGRAFTFAGPDGYAVTVHDQD